MFSYNAFLPQSEIDALVLMIAPSLPKILPETPHGTMQGQTPSPLQKSCPLLLLEAGSGTIVTRNRDPAGTSASDSWRLDLDWAGLANYVDHGGEQVMRIMSGCKWRWPPQAGVHGVESVRGVCIEKPSEAESRN